MPSLLESLKQLESERPKYEPSDTAQKLIGAVWEKWNQAQAQRQSDYRQFNDRSLETYVQDSVDRWNGYKTPRTDPASDWGARVFDNETRDKAISVIAQVTAEQIKSEFFAQLEGDDNDKRAAQLIRHLHDYSWYKNRDDEQQFYAVVEATIKGTVVGYEGYKVDQRKIKEIDKYDPDTGEVEFTEKTIKDWDDVYGEVIPLMDFYPGNVWVKDIQKQPFVIWRTVLDYEVFLADFEKYPNVKFVSPGRAEMRSGAEDTQSTREDRAKDENQFVSPTVLENQVEVLRYFDKWNDEFYIIANGVLLTPEVSPLPWDHKNYPFWKSVFEPFSIDFFYGKSLPDKLRDNQDVLNTLYEMMLDQGFLSVNPPILTQGVEGIRDEMLYPGRMIQVDDVQQTREMQISPPNIAHFRIIEMIKKNIGRSSFDAPLDSLEGTRLTAFEVGLAKESAQKILALFLRTLEWGVRDKTELRVANILQFYRLPKISEIVTEEDAMEYRSFVLDNVELADGTKGKQIIQVVNGPGDLPLQDVVNERELNRLKEGENVAFSYITTDMLRNIDLRVKIIPNSSVKMSEALKRALELDYQAKANMLYPDLFNREEGFREFNEVFDKDPGRMMNQMTPPGTIDPMTGQPIPAEGAVPPGGVQPNQTPNSGAVPKTPNNAAQAGVPTPNTAMNSLRNTGAQ